jgi:hypothetical protein
MEQTAEAAAAARASTLVDAEAEREESVHVALAAAAKDFKAQLTIALTTMREALDKDKGAEIARALVAARAVYDVSAREVAARAEAERAELVESCERGLAIARRQVVAAETAAERAAAGLRAIESELDRRAALEGGRVGSVAGVAAAAAAAAGSAVPLPPLPPPPPAPAVRPTAAAMFGSAPRAAEEGEGPPSPLGSGIRVTVSSSPHAHPPPSPPPACPPGVSSRLYSAILRMSPSSLHAMLARSSVPYDESWGAGELRSRLLAAVAKGQQEQEEGAGGERESRPRSPVPPAPFLARVEEEVEGGGEEVEAGKNSDEGSPTDAAAATWLPAVAEDGRPYFYHSLTRAVRWEVPDEATSARVEERRAADERALRARQAERLAELASAADSAAAERVGRAALEAEVDGRVREWSRAGTRLLRVLLCSLPSVLQARPGCVPTEVVALATTGGAEELKRAYRTALRVVHPDKLGGGSGREGVSVEAQVEAARVFAVLSEAYRRHASGEDRDVGSQAHGSGRAAGHSGYTGHGSAFAAGHAHPYAHRSAGTAAPPHYAARAPPEVPYHPYYGGGSGGDRRPAPAPPGMAGTAADPYGGNAANVMAAAAARARQTVERMHAAQRAAGVSRVNYATAGLATGGASGPSSRSSTQTRW